MNTILFAAGASYDFFSPKLNTQYLTQQILNKDNWIDVINKYKSIKGGDILITNPDNILDVIKIIRKLRPKANFEQIAEVIDKVSSISFDAITDDNILNLFEKTVEQILNVRSAVSLRSFWMHSIPFLFRQIISESILDLETNHKSVVYNDLIQKQKEFIEHILKNGGDNISIISTNYDDCVLNSIEGLGINTCLTTIDARYPNQVDTLSFMNSSKVIMFPHGHLRFQMLDNMQISMWDDIQTANQNRWKGLSSLNIPSTITVFQDSFSYNFNTFLTTGQTKDSAFNNLPYSLYYQRMAIDFARSNNIIIIGYSFRDEHINRLLQTFLEINPVHHLFVVDYYPQEITMTEEYMDMDNIISKIHLLFRQHWYMRHNANTDTFEPFYSDEVESINKIGYGRIFPQITFYRKGYSAFLKEYDQVINENIL